MESGNKIKQMDLVAFILWTMMFMKVNGKIVKKMAEENINAPTEIDLRDYGFYILYHDIWFIKFHWKYLK